MSNWNGCTPFVEGYKISKESQAQRQLTMQSSEWLHNKSGHKGVCRDNGRGKWLAYLNMNGEQVFRKRCSSYADAVKARQEAELEYWT